MGNSSAAYYMDPTGSIVVTELKANTPALTPARPHTMPKDDRESNLSFNTAADNVASWGTNNLFPQEVLEKVEKTDLLSSYLNWIVKAMLSGSLEYGYERFDNGTKKRYFEPVFENEIEDFLECSRIREDYLPGSTVDMKYLAHIFPEFVLNRNRTKIASVQRMDASWCRFQLQNESTRQIDKAWISADWRYQSGFLSRDSVEQANVFMPQNNQVEKLRQKRGLYKFLYPVSYPKIGKFYYALAPWHPIMASGWLDLLINIPEIKNKYFENSLKLKYHIEVDERYWPISIPNWDQMDMAKKIQAKRDKMEELGNIFSDTEGAGKTVKTEMLFDDHQRQQWSLIKVHEMKNTIQDGLLKEDTIEASGHLCAALNIDPTLVSTPQKGMGAGSGSDKMRAWEVFTMISVLEQNKILAPLNFMAEFNGYPRLKFRFNMHNMNTLNEVSPANRSLNE